MALDGPIGDFALNAVTILSLPTYMGELLPDECFPRAIFQSGYGHSTSLVRAEMTLPQL
jgi:hypothetical protein